VPGSSRKTVRPCRQCQRRHFAPRTLMGVPEFKPFFGMDWYCRFQEPDGSDRKPITTHSEKLTIRESHPSWITQLGVAQFLTSTFSACTLRRARVGPGPGEPSGGAPHEADAGGRVMTENEGSRAHRHPDAVAYLESLTEDGGGGAFRSGAASWRADAGSSGCGPGARERAGPGGAPTPCWR